MNQTDLWRVLTDQGEFFYDPYDWEMAEKRAKLPKTKLTVIVYRMQVWQRYLRGKIVLEVEAPNGYEETSRYKKTSGKTLHR